MSNLIEDKFEVSDQRPESGVFRISRGFALTCKFQNIASVDISIYLGASPEQLVEDTSLAKTLTTTDSEAWEIETYMRFAKVITTSEDPYSGTFYIART